MIPFFVPEKYHQDAGIQVFTPREVQVRVPTTQFSGGYFQFFSSYSLWGASVPASVPRLYHTTLKPHTPLHPLE